MSTKDDFERHEQALRELRGIAREQDAHISRLETDLAVLQARVAMYAATWGAGISIAVSVIFKLWK